MPDLHQENCTTRNWLELPEDVMILIFKKLSVLEILLNAQMVCTSWQKLAREPQIYCAINLEHAEDYFTYALFFKDFVKDVMGRSCGHMVEFSCTVSSLVTFEVLDYVVDQSCRSLKALRMSDWCHNATRALSLLAVGLPDLEKLDLRCTYDVSETIQELGRFCSKLRYLRLDFMKLHPNWDFFADDDALAIGANMSQLHQLHLNEWPLTNKGLQAILDGCPRLEYLVLKSCPKINLKGGLRLNRVRNIRSSDESNHNYEMVLNISD